MGEVHTFKEKNEIGKIFENFIISDIQNKKYVTTHKYTPNNGDYDIFIDEINEGIECKDDLESVNSNNICIEFSQDGRDSGIRITKAKYWIQYDQTYLYLALTKQIKFLVDSYDEYHENLICLSEELGRSNFTNLQCKEKLNEFDVASHEKYGEMFNDIRYKNKIGKIYSKINQGNYDKIMGLYLITKDMYNEYSLERTSKNEMTYNDLK